MLLQEWPENVIGVVGEFNSDEEAAETIEKVWSAAGGTVHHVCNSLGFGSTDKTYSESNFDYMKEAVDTHASARLRAHPLCAAKLLNVEGASLTTLSGAFAHGTHTFDGGSGLWRAGVTGALYVQSNYAVAAEVRDKKGQLRSSAAVVHILVSKNGETQQQFGMPAEADSSIHLGKAFVGIALDSSAPNGHCYELTNFDVVDSFVSNVYEGRSGKNVMILGASGMVGSRLAAEATERGHNVTAVSRKGDVSVDANDSAALEKVLREKATDVLVVALGPIRGADGAHDPSAHPALKDTYASIIGAVRAVGASVKVFFVGGAGSLIVSPEAGMVQDQEWFPKNIYPEANAHTEGLAFLKTVTDVTWTYMSPPPYIQPGKRTTRVVVAEGDGMVGQSVSAEDYAIAAFDEVDNGFAHAGKRLAVATPL